MVLALLAIFAVSGGLFGVLYQRKPEAAQIINCTEPQPSGEGVLAISPKVVYPGETFEVNFTLPENIVSRNNEDYLTPIWNYDPGSILWSGGVKSISIGVGNNAIANEASNLEGGVSSFSGGSANWYATGDGKNTNGPNHPNKFDEIKLFYDTNAPVYGSGKRIFGSNVAAAEQFDGEPTNWFTGGTSVSAKFTASKTTKGWRYAAGSFTYNLNPYLGYADSNDYSHAYYLVPGTIKVLQPQGVNPEEAVVAGVPINFLTYPDQGGGEIIGFGVTNGKVDPASLDSGGQISLASGQGHFTVIPEKTGSLTVNLTFKDYCGYESSKSITLGPAFNLDLSLDPDTPRFIGNPEKSTEFMATASGNSTINFEGAEVALANGEKKDSYSLSQDLPTKFLATGLQPGTTKISGTTTNGESATDDLLINTYQLKLVDSEELSPLRAEENDGKYSKLEFGIDGWDKIADDQKQAFKDYFTGKKYEPKIVDKDGNELPFTFRTEEPTKNPAGDITDPAKADLGETSFDIDTETFTKSIVTSTHDPSLKDHPDKLEGAKLRLAISDTDPKAEQDFELGVGEAGDVVVISCPNQNNDQAGSVDIVEKAIAAEEIGSCTKYSKYIPSDSEVWILFPYGLEVSPSTINELLRLTATLDTKFIYDVTNITPLSRILEPKKEFPISKLEKIVWQGTRAEFKDSLDEVTTALGSAKFIGGTSPVFAAFRVKTPTYDAVSKAVNYLMDATVQGEFRLQRIQNATSSNPLIDAVAAQDDELLAEKKFERKVPLPGEITSTLSKIKRGDEEKEIGKYKPEEDVVIAGDELTFNVAWKNTAQFPIPLEDYEFKLNFDQVDYVDFVSSENSGELKSKGQVSWKGSNLAQEVGAGESVSTKVTLKLKDDLPLVDGEEIVDQITLAPQTIIGGEVEVEGKKLSIDFYEVVTGKLTGPYNFPVSKVKMESRNLSEESMSKFVENIQNATIESGSIEGLASLLDADPDTLKNDLNLNTAEFGSKYSSQINALSVRSNTSLSAKLNEDNWAVSDDDGNFELAINRRSQISANNSIGLCVSFATSEEPWLSAENNFSDNYRICFAKKEITKNLKLDLEIKNANDVSEDVEFSDLGEDEVILGFLTIYHDIIEFRKIIENESENIDFDNNPIVLTLTESVLSDLNFSGAQGQLGITSSVDNISNIGKYSDHNPISIYHEMGHYLEYIVGGQEFFGSGNNHWGYLNDSSADSVSEGFATAIGLYVFSQQYSNFNGDYKPFSPWVVFNIKNGPYLPAYSTAIESLTRVGNISNPVVDANLESKNFFTEDAETYVAARILWTLMNGDNSVNTNVQWIAEDAKSPLLERTITELPPGGITSAVEILQLPKSDGLTLGDIYSNLIDKKTDLRTLYLVYGICADKNFDWYCNQGEVGRPANYSAFNFHGFNIPGRPDRKLTPPIHEGSFIKTSYKGFHSNPTLAVNVDWEVQEEQGGELNFDYSWEDNQLMPIGFIHPIVKGKATISTDGSRDVLVLDQSRYWNAIFAGQMKYIAEHTFNFDGSPRPTKEEVLKALEDQGKSVGSIYVPYEGKEQQVQETKTTLIATKTDSGEEANELNQGDSVDLALSNVNSGTNEEEKVEVTVNGETVAEVPVTADNFGVKVKIPDNAKAGDGELAVLTPTGEKISKDVKINSTRNYLVLWYGGIVLGLLLIGGIVYIVRSRFKTTSNIDIDDELIDLADNDTETPGEIKPNDSSDTGTIKQEKTPPNDQGGAGAA